jgi:hypothetical protein
MTSCKKHFIALTKRESGRIFFVTTDPTFVNTSTSVRKNTGKYESIGDNKDEIKVTVI